MRHCCVNYVCGVDVSARRMKCEQCAASFSRASDLKRHVASLHPPSTSRTQLLLALETAPGITISSEPAMGDRNPGPSTSFSDLLTSNQDPLFDLGSDLEAFGHVVARGVTTSPPPSKTRRENCLESQAHLAEGARVTECMAEVHQEDEPAASVERDRALPSSLTSAQGTEPARVRSPAVQAVSPVVPRDTSLRSTVDDGEVRTLLTGLSSPDRAVLNLFKYRPDLDLVTYEQELVEAGHNRVQVGELLQAFVRHRETIRSLMTDLVVWREQQVVRTGSEAEADRWLRMAVLKYAAADNPAPF